MTASPRGRALYALPVFALAAWSVVLPLAAHDDDPKVLDRERPVLGPGYRAGAPVGPGGPSASAGFEADGIDLLAWLPLNLLDPAATSGNDCWGYVSPSGREYALVGTSAGTSFVEVTVPGLPVLVQNIAGPTSLWRDIKTYDHYAYAVSEGGDGIQVIDLANIDSGTVTLVTTILGPGSTSTHNLGIDQDSGFLYRFGGANHGARIYDLQNPAAPLYVASWDERYIHDAEVVTYQNGPLAGRQIVFACSGLNGGFDFTGLTIVDVTDKSNIVVLDQHFYPNPGYSHQGWLSPDRQYFYLGDELDEDGTFPTTVYVIDVSDPTNATTVTSFTNGNAAITHNLYTQDNLIFAANYTSGLRVFDASDPLAVVEVAWFDTRPADDNASFNGLWSCYPYFPSGTIIGSDLESGLFVWELAGSIDIRLPGGPPEIIDPAGDTAAVVITEDQPGDLLPGSAMLQLDDGSGFVSFPLTDLGAGNFEAPFPPLACGTEVRWFLEAMDAGGKLRTDPIGAPGFAYVSFAVDGLNTVLEHDMELSQGWSAGAPGDNATTGVWVRVDPRGTAAQPEDDHTPSGVNCWVTGQGSPGGSVGENDVDSGHTTLVSPLYDLTGLDNPSFAYWRWYSNDQGGAPNQDVFRVDLSADGGVNWSAVEVVGPGGLESSGGWIEHRFRVSDVLPPSSQMVLRFIAEDASDGSIVEAAIDDLRIIETVCDTSVGLPFCDPGAVNSTGLPGLLAAEGSAVVTDDDLTAHAAQLPPGGFAILLVSDRRGGAARPGPLGSPGSSLGLCVGAPFAAFHQTAGTADGAGQISFPIDPGAIPTWQGPVSAMAGETWLFQTAYRDAGAILFSNGLSITFQ